MGLSAMADMPDMDQALRFANASGAMQYITPHQWVGEQNLNGLGLADSQTDIASGFSQAGSLFQQVYGTIEAAKLGKIAAKNAAKAPAKPPPQSLPPPEHSSGGSSMGTIFLIGGVAVVGIIVLMMVMKKKKGDDKGA